MNGSTSLNDHCNFTAAGTGNMENGQTIGSSFVPGAIRVRTTLSYSVPSVFSVLKSFLVFSTA